MCRRIRVRKEKKQVNPGPVWIKEKKRKGHFKEVKIYMVTFSGFGPDY